MAHKKWSEIKHKKPPLWRFRARLAWRRRRNYYRRETQATWAAYRRPRHLMPRLCVDFNMPKTLDVISEGDSVVMFDGDGNECLGIVTEIAYRKKGGPHNQPMVLIYAEIDELDSWVDGPEEWAALPHQTLVWRAVVRTKKETQ